VLTSADGSYSINYQRALTMPKYVFSNRADIGMDMGQTIGRDEVSAALSNLGSGDSLSRRIWDKVLLENCDDVVHVLSLKGLFLYLSPSSSKILEYEPSELMGTALSSVCHPSDIVPVTRELKDTSNTLTVNIVFRIRRKKSGYMWFEGHGSLHTEQGKGRKCIIMVGRERPVYTLDKTELRANGGIGDNELWTKMSTAGMFLFVSANVRQMLDRQPEELIGTSIQSLMRQDSKVEFGRILELARTGKKASTKHEVINKRGQVLQAFTTVYPGDAEEGQKPTFLVAQTKLLKFSRATQAAKAQALAKQETSSSGMVSSTSNLEVQRRGSSSLDNSTPNTSLTGSNGFFIGTDGIATTIAGLHGLPIGHQDASLASDENLFDELKTTRSTSWQYELRQMEKRNRLLAEEVQSLLAAKKKRKRRKGAGQLQKDCANCHTRVTPEWRRGPSGNRDLCNSCGLRYAKQVKLNDGTSSKRISIADGMSQLQNGRAASKTSSKRSGGSVHSDKASKASASPQHGVYKLPTDGSGHSSAASAVIAAAPSTVGGNASPRQARPDEAASTVPMDLSSNQAFPGTNPLPAKIDEAVEPAE
jgi:PAS domain S-box-containing protein